MDTFLRYMQVFLVGGIICTIGQILIIKTKLTSARILVFFVMLGAIIEGIGWYEPIIEFGGAGAIVPITGFGRSLAKGAIQGVRDYGLLGVFTGGLTATSAGIAAAVIFAYLFGIIFSSQSKK